MSTYVDRLRQQFPGLQSPDISDDDIIGYVSRNRPDLMAGMEQDEFQRFAVNDDWAVTRGFKAGIDQIQGIGGGLLGALGDATGSDALRDKGLDIYQRNMDEAALYGRPELTEIDDVSSALEWAGYTLGNLAPMMAPSLVTGGVGGILAKQGAQTAAKRLVADMVARGAARDVARREAGKMIAKQVAAGGTLGALPSGVGLGVGEIYGDTEALGVSLAHGAVSGVLDSLPIGRALNKLGIGKAAKDAVKTTVAGELLKQGGAEMTTEALQTLVEQHARYWVENEGRSLLGDTGAIDWKEILEASAAGALGGGVMGGGIRALTGETTQENANTRIENAGAEVLRRGGDALEAELARAEAAAQELPGAAQRAALDAAQPIPTISPAEAATSGTEVKVPTGEADAAIRTLEARGMAVTGRRDANGTTTLTVGRAQDSAFDADQMAPIQVGSQAQPDIWDAPAVAPDRTLTGADLGVSFPETPAPAAAPERAEAGIDSDPGQVPYADTRRPQASSWQPAVSGIEDALQEAEAFGQNERAVRLRNLRSLYQRAERLVADGQPEAAQRMVSRANAIHEQLIGPPPVTEPTPTIAGALPAPALEGAVEGGDIVPAQPQPGRQGRTMEGERPPAELTDGRRTALPAPSTAGLLGSEGVIYGEAPAGQAAARDRTRNAMEGEQPIGTDWRPGADARAEQSALQRAQNAEAGLERVSSRDDQSTPVKYDLDPELLPIVREQGLPDEWASPGVRGDVEYLLTYLEEGGGMETLVDDMQRVTGRTPSVNLDWYQANAKELGSVGYVKATVAKALKGDKLGPKQKRVIETLMEEAEPLARGTEDWAAAELEDTYGDARDQAVATGVAQPRSRYDDRTGDMFGGAEQGASQKIDGSDRITATEQQGDMFGADSQRQEMADEVRRMDRRRSPGTDVPAGIDGGLFSDAQRQTDIADAEPSPLDADRLSPGDTVQLFWLATDRYEDVQYRGRQGDQAVVVKDGMQLSVPFADLRQSSPSGVSDRAATYGEGDQTYRVSRRSADGSFTVTGNLEAARAALPENVRGTPARGGLSFRGPGANRAYNALTGVGGYSRGGEVRKHPMKDGKYVGAPPRYNTPGKIGTMRRKLRELAREGEYGRMWYENSGKAVLRLVGGDKREARKLIALLSIYSPQAAVSANTTFALRAWAQYKAGKPINVKSGDQDAKAQAAMDDIDSAWGALWSGEKTGNFVQNLMAAIEPGIAQGVTTDLWVMRAMGYDTSAPNRSQYAFSEIEINRIAKEMGWEPHQVQAAIWVAIKSRAENAAVKAATEKKSLRRGYIHYKTGSKGKPVRVYDNEPAHYALWHDEAMRHNPDAQDKQTAKFDYEDGFYRHISDVALSDRVIDVMDQLRDADGNDLLAQRVGLLVERAPEGDRLRVITAQEKGGSTTGNKTIFTDPDQEALINAYVSILGALAGEPSMTWHRPFVGANKSDHNAVRVNLGQALSADQVDALSALTEQPGVSILSTETGVQIVDTTGTADLDQVVSDLESLLDRDLDQNLETFYASGRAIQGGRNDETYQRQIRAAGQSSVFRWAQDRVAGSDQSVTGDAREGGQDQGRQEITGVSERRRGDDRTLDILEQLEQADPYERADTRAESTDRQREVGRDALRDLLRLLKSSVRAAGVHDAGSDSAVSVLGLRIARRFAAGRPAALVGETISGPADLAALAQVYRDPRFETFRYILLDENDRVIGERTTTSRLPSAVAFGNAEKIVKSVRNAVEATGAASYYLIHNHPSGRSEPSPADIGVTRLVAEDVPGFRGHVVIDTNEYTTIDASGGTQLTQDESLQSRDFWADPAVPNEHLGRHIHGPADVARVAKAVASDEQAVIITTAGGQNQEVNSISSIPLPVMDAAIDGTAEVSERLGKMLLAMKRNTGSGGGTVVVLPRNVQDANRYRELMDTFAMDVMTADGVGITSNTRVLQFEGDPSLYISDTDQRERKVENRGLGWGVTEEKAAYDRLSALHNLSAENLLHAADLGGIAVPSVAVVKDGMGMEGFGDITLIGTKDLVDPKRVPVYDADAYTMRFPQPDYGKASRKKAQALVDALRPYVDKYERGRYALDHAFAAANGTQPREVLAQLLRSNAMKAMYVKETQGVDARSRRRAMPLGAAYADNPKIVAFFKGRLRELRDAGYNGERTMAARRELADIYAEVIREEPNVPADLADDLIRLEVRDGMLGFRTYDKLLYAQFNLGKTEVDEAAIQKTLDARLKGKEAKFHAWVSRKVMDMYGEPKVTVGRKKVPYTLPNIVDAMTGWRDARGREATMTFSPGMTRAMASTRFNDLEWMRNAAKDAIQDEAAAKAAREGSEKLLEQYREAVLPYYAYSDTRAALDDSMEALAKWARGRLRGDPKSVMRQALGGMDFKRVPDDVLELAVKAGNAMLEAPVPYFEAKPQRAVGLDEFAGAVLPKGADPKAREALERAGVRIAEYKKGDEADRLRAVNRLRGQLAKQGSEVLFSRRQQTQTPEFKQWFGDWEAVRANESVNRAITQWAAGRMASNEVIDIGRPSDVLRRFGVPDRPIHMAQRVLNKAVNRKHEVDVSDLRDLALNLQAPLAVFSSSRGESHRVIVTEARHQSGNVVVALDIEAKRQGLEINDITSVYPKRDGSIARWINEGRLLGYEKDKGREWIENSAGSDSRQFSPNATPAQPIVYDTGHLRKASKAVDESGAPLVVYHTTSADFSEFRTNNDLGAHFGTPEQTDSFAPSDGQRVVPVYLSIKNPLRLEDRGGFQFYEVREQLVELGILSEERADWIDENLTIEDSTLAMQEAIKAAGYDGVVYLNRREGDHDPFGEDGVDGEALDSMTDEEVLEEFPSAQDSYIAFDPEQIKSATGNRGTFDPNSPDITQSRSTGPADPHTPGSLRASMDNAFRGVADALERGGRLKVISRADIPENLQALNSISAWHGSPHKFDKFSMDAIGSGEGAQAYGRGLYFADRRGVGEDYKQRLAGSGVDGTLLSIRTDAEAIGARFPELSNEEVAALQSILESAAQAPGKNSSLRAVYADLLDMRTSLESDVNDGELYPSEVAEAEARLSDVETQIRLLEDDELGIMSSGALYNVEIDVDPEAMLQWDKPLSEQSENVRAAFIEWLKRKDPDLESAMAAGYDVFSSGRTNGPERSGQAFYTEALRDMPGEERAAFLRDAGIPGIRYLDGASRNKPLRDIKREFLDALPEDAEIQDVLDMLDGGAFSDANSAFLNALADDDWLGFDYPAQAISAALTEDTSRYDMSQELLDAREALQSDDATYNYVVFDDELISIKDVYYSKDGDIQAYVVDGVVHMVADNIDRSTSVKGLMMHEIGVHLTRLGKDDAEFQDMLRQMERLRDMGSKAAVEAFARVPADTPEHLVTEEALGYLAEGHPDVSLSKRLVAWMKAKLREWLRALPGAERMKAMQWANNLTEMDLVVMAQAATRQAAQMRAVDGGGAQSRTMGWEGFPDAIIAHRSVQDHPDYRAAKEGDTDAAMRLAADRVTDEYVEKVRAAIGGTDPAVAPVLAVEAAGDNKIPLAVADELAGRLGLAVDASLLQSDKVSRGGSSGFHRLANQPRFAGEVQAKDYIIVDDTLARGGTLAQLKEHIEKNGGRVILATALTGKQYSSRLALEPDMLDAVRAKYADIEPWFTSEFGYDFSGLTQSEARYIVKSGATPDALRVRILEARDAGGPGLFAGQEGGEVRGPAPDGDLDSPDTRFSRRTGDPSGINDASGQYATRRTPKPFTEQVGFDDQLTRMDKLRSLFVNRFHALEKVQKAQADQSADPMTAITLFPGTTRARLDDFEQNTVEPLAKAIQDTGLGFAKVAEWLHARHAKEANRVLKERNLEREDNEALSGMTDAEAEKILKLYGNHKRLAEVGRLVDELNAAHLEQMVADELITQAEADQMAAAYEHYVPLHREDMDMGATGRGQGFDIRGKETKLRVGSSARKVDYENMIAHLVAQSQGSIVRGEKNRVGQRMYQMAVDNPDSQFWTVTDLPQDPYLNAAGQVGYRSNVRTSEVLSVKFGGEQKYVWFNPDSEHATKVAAGMKNLSGGEQNKVTSMLLGINRYLSAINTSLSPEFVISNFFRDVQTAGYNLTDTELKDMELKVMKGTPSAMRAIKSALRGDGSHPKAAMFEEFRKAGGMTGWIQHYDSIERQMKSIESTLDWSTTPGKKQIRSAMKFIEDYNQIVENGVRLSTYIAARDLGISKEKAARMAKEVTVDFNRRGEWGTAMNAMYLFYNASVQGSARMLRAMANPKNKKLQAMVGGTIVFAAALDAWNRAVSDDEDDDELSGYDKIPDHVKDRNLVIWDVMGVTEKGYFKIPLPWGYNVFHIAGQELSKAGAAAAGEYMGYSALDSAARIAGGFLDAFNPVSDGSLLQTAMPTVLDPVARLAENKDWHGGPLYPNYNKSAPDYTKYFSNVRESSKEAAGWLGELTRDPETLKSAVDISPEWIDMMVDFVTGSVGRVVVDAFEGSRALAKGEPREWNEIPIIRKVVGEVGDSAEKSEFYERFYEIEDIRSELSRVRREDPGSYSSTLSGIGTRRLLLEYTKQTKSRMNNLKKTMREAERRGNTDLAESMEQRILDLMRQYVRRYNQVMYKDAA